MNERLTVTASEAAEIIGCSRNQVYELVQRHVLPVVPHMGRRVLIPRTAVERLVAGESEAVG